MAILAKYCGLLKTIYKIYIYIYIKVFALSIVRPLERLSIKAGLVLSSIVFIQFLFFVNTLFMKCNHL